MNAKARARRLARAERRARRRLLQLKRAVERFGPARPELWSAPYGAGIAFRHLLLAGEEAGLWRFGLFANLPEGAAFETLAPVVPEVFGDGARGFAETLRRCAGPATDPDEAAAFELGVRRADGILAATLKGAKRDPFVIAASRRYANMKRGVGRPAFVFSARRRYAFFVVSALCADFYGVPLNEAEAAAALWPRRSGGVAQRLGLKEGPA